MTTSAIAPRYLARHRFARITARKARYIADLIRGRSVNEALDLLAFQKVRGTVFYKKLLQSAMANANQEAGVNVNQLRIVDARADDGPMMQGRLRFRPGPQGRAMPFKRMTSHLTIGLAAPEGVPDVRARATKSAARTPAKTAAAKTTAAKAAGAKSSKSSKPSKP